MNPVNACTKYFEQTRPGTFRPKKNKKCHQKHIFDEEVSPSGGLRTTRNAYTFGAQTDALQDGSDA